MKRIFNFELIKDNEAARLGKIITARGEIDTPVFMPVGTRASVKTMSPKELEESDVQIILGNTYHLYLKPGDKLIKKMGGLHRFMNWENPILTDSGGFQVFSLGLGSKHDKLVRIEDKGVHFKSHIDGSSHFFTPRGVLEIQHNLGSDIAMVLDECAPGRSTKLYAEAAMNRTHRWAEESKKHMEKGKYDMAVFGIVQGGTYKDLRNASAKFINDLDFDGNAIGGLAVGETKTKMYRVIEEVTPLLSNQKPRYLMGVGTPEDILEAVARGVDMFDCVHPTRIARNGTVMTTEGKLNLLNSKHKDSDLPIEVGCDCYACTNFSRSYIRHLLNVGEVLGIRLTTLHNVRFMMRLMGDIRHSIKEDKFVKFKENFLTKYRA